jgi:hypothetical protein
MKDDALVRIAGLCETFCLDVAVLVFVFPALDTVVTFGAQRLTFKFALVTLSVSGIFFLAAVILGMFIARTERAR